MAVVDKCGQVPSCPHSLAEGPAPLAQRAVAPGRGGEGCQDSSFVVKHEAGVGEGAVLQEFN